MVESVLTVTFFRFWFFINFYWKRKYTFIHGTFLLLSFFVKVALVLYTIYIGFWHILGF